MLIKERWINSMQEKNKKKKSNNDPLNKDLSSMMKNGKWVKFSELFQMQPKNKTITLRVSEDLLNELKVIAKSEDSDYQKMIRNVLIDFVSKKAA